MYPEYVEIERKQYKINTDYKIALACFKVIRDEEINDIARTITIISLLFGQKDENNELKVPEFSDLTKVVKLIEKYLCCSQTDEQNKDIKKIDMDFEQDEKYIVASFWSDYGIDLDITDMHWWKFCNLLGGLTENCVLSKVREIRNIDLSEYKDEKIKAKMAEAKENVKLKTKKTVEEEEAEEEFNKLFM